MTPRDHIVENRVIRQGSLLCPSPAFCDKLKGETYERYVKRHAGDHGLGLFDSFEDAERNLALWCFYFCHKYILGNESLGVDPKSTDGFNPFWEDHFFLANWSLSPEDLEQDVPWHERRHRLPSVDGQKPGTLKKFKKITKPRGSQKTSLGLAYVTFEHLRAYFVDQNPHFRVLVISATSSLARKAYYNSLKVMWAAHENLTRLFGSMSYVRSSPECSRDCDATCEHKERPLCLLAMGSKSSDSLRMRWNVNQKNTSRVVTSFGIGGVDTTLAGSRWDLVLFDDPVVPQNVDTQDQREKVKRCHADLRKQLLASGRLLWLNTPYHLDDASMEIDTKYKDEFHILQRPAVWVDPETKETVYYIERFADGVECWPRERIEKERRQPDFSSQVLLQPRDPQTSLFDERDFPVVPIRQAPVEIVAGLGSPITPEQEMMLQREGAYVRSYLLVDPSGNEDQKKYGDDSAIIGVRLSRWGEIYIVYIAAGQFGSLEEKEQMFAAWVHTGAQLIDYELPAANSKDVIPAFTYWQREKSIQMNMPVMMPMKWRKPSTSVGKMRSMESLQPFAKQGKIKFLDTVPELLRQKLVFQLVNMYVTDHDDLGDALSRVLAYITPNLFQNKVALEAAVEADPCVIPGAVALAGMGVPKSSGNWGLRGRRFAHV